MSLSEAFRHWMIAPVIDFVRSELKKTEERIMAQTQKDIDAETLKLGTLISATAQDVLAAIKALSDARNAGEDDTVQFNNLVALEKPLQDMDASAQAVINPPPPPPPPPAA